MHKLEIELINTTDGLRSEDSWIIIDGAVKLDEFVKKPFLVGVAKSFSKKPEFHFSGSVRRRNIDVTALLDLDPAHSDV